MSEVIGTSPAGQIEKIENLKKRQRTIYWRPIKDEEGNVINWVETQPLPSDSQGRELYFSKGFRLSPPRTDTTAPEGFTVVDTVDQEKEDLLAENQRLRKLLEEKPEAPQRKAHRKTRKQ